MAKANFKKNFEGLYNNIIDGVVNYVYNSKKEYKTENEMLEDVKNHLELDQKKSKNSPKTKKDHRWITLDEYIKEVDEGKLICAYTSVRGSYKFRPCGNLMSAEDLRLVNNDKTALRCHLCHSNNPPKPKTGCIRKLLEERNGKTVQPNKVPGVNIPDDQGIKNLMGFISGKDNAPTIEEVTGEKDLKFEELKDDFKINYEKGWVMKDNNICGKLLEFTKETEFESSKIIELTIEEIKSCEKYKLTYKYNTQDGKEEGENEEDILNDLGNVN